MKKLKENLKIANKYRSKPPNFGKGDKVWLESSLNINRSEFSSKNNLYFEFLLIK